MARTFGARGERESAQPGRIAAAASAVAVLSLTFVLMGWMLARVAEHPGVPRVAGELPRWFAGEPAMRGARERTPAPAAGEHGDEAVASINPGAIATRAQEKTGAAQGDYTEFAGGQIEIAFLEYEMKPSRIRVNPGTVTFVLRNEGRFAHDFHIEGPGVDAYAAKFSPGRTVRLEVALPEGEYKISCPLSNHDQRGMHGTLVVTSKVAGK